MRKFLVACGIIAALLCSSIVVLSTPAAGASQLYQCIYRWYPYSEIWTTNGNHAMYLNSNGWRCVKWR